MRNIIIIILFFGVSCFAQETKTTETCLTDFLLQNSLKENPFLQKYLDEIDFQVEKSQSQLKNLVTPVVTIPVAVCIVHKGTNTISNISDNQVLSQIAALNEYFNPYGLKFCLATKIGNSSIPNSGGVQNTPGIIHKLESDLSDHNASTEQQNLLQLFNQLDPQKYLKIWVVNSISNTGSPGTALGYSMFPGESNFDGVVMRYDAFGDIGNNCSNCTLHPVYNQGKTLVHEIGHYLGLYHTFHEGCNSINSSNCSLQGDRICDTPPVKQPNFGCIEGTNSCHEASPDLPDLIHNYMDYGSDNCLDSFTENQKNRIFSVLTNYRSELISTDNLIYTGVCNYENLVSASFTPTSYLICSNSTVQFTPITTGTNITYQWNFGDPDSGLNNSSTSSQPIHLFSNSNNSPYTVSLTVTKNGQSFISTSQIFVENCSPISNSEGNWYFSSSNGLNFSSGIPVYDNSIPPSNQFGEACAVMNNSSGNLLFYTNNVRVWNKDHVSINNNTPLLGHQSSKGGCLIIPDPGNPNEYYIFTKAAYDAQNGFRYSKVAISGNLASMTSVINQPINFPSDYISGNNGAKIGGEGLGAIENCDGYWIITCLRKSSGLFLVSYSLTSSGLNFVNEVALPTIANQAPFPVSFIEISPDANRVLYANSAINTYIYNFNKHTGQFIENPLILETQGTSGASFSPNSQLLYLDHSMKYYQLNLNSTNIFDTKFLIGGSALQKGDMQSGPDNKIYISQITSRKLATIHNPDILITEGNPNICLFTNNGPIVENALGFSLPNIVDANFENAYNNTITATPKSCFMYKFDANICTTTFNWNFGDPNSGSNNLSTLSNPVHTFSDYGNYTVTLISGTNSITYNIEISEINPTILGNSTACIETNPITNNSVVLPSGQTAVWSASSNGSISGLNNQSDVTVNWSSLPGTLTLTVTSPNGCTITKTKVINSQCGNETNCPTALTFSTTENGAFSEYEASNSITTNGNYVVNANSDVTLKAGSEIVISNSSHIKANSSFLAKIEDCSNSQRIVENLEKNIAPEKNLAVYPNPTNGIINIQATNSNITEIIINSIDGKLIDRKTTQEVNFYQMDLSKCMKGIYLMTVRTSDGKLHVSKIAKQ